MTRLESLRAERAAARIQELGLLAQLESYRVAQRRLAPGSPRWLKLDEVAALTESRDLRAVSARIAALDDTISGRQAAALWAAYCAAAEGAALWTNAGAEDTECGRAAVLLAAKARAAYEGAVTL